MVKVAVVGASGFVGSRVVEMLHLGGTVEVRPVVRAFASLARVARFDLDFCVADALDASALQRAFAGCDTVIHAMAGSAEVIVGAIAPLMHAAQAAGVRRVVYLSSASVHGQAPLPNTHEGSALSDRQPLAYNNAKVRAEWTLRDLRKQGDVEVVVLRPGIVVGPRSSWVVNFADALLQGHAYLVNRGQGICNHIYIDNLVDAIGLAMTCRGVDGEVFLLGEPDLLTWADFYRPLAEALGYAIEEVPEAEVPEFGPGWQEHLRRVHKSRFVQSVLSHFPQQARQAVFDALMASMKTTPSPWALPVATRPVATQEMAMLYRCQTHLPYAKAAAQLGYAPRIGLAEATARTIGWMAFAGYPIKHRVDAVAQNYAWEWGNDGR